MARDLTARKIVESRGKAIVGTVALGEILVELGFIKRQHLRKTRKWQQQLRPTAIALAFLAPLLSPFTVQAAKFESTQTGEAARTKTGKGHGKGSGKNQPAPEPGHAPEPVPEPAPEPAPEPRVGLFAALMWKLERREFNLLPPWPTQLRPVNLVPCGNGLLSHGSLFLIA